MPESKLRHHRRSVIVIGCDDIGSAIACVLHRAGAAVVVVDTTDPPWACRGRSYTDAWYVGGATLDAIDACFCGAVKSIPAILDRDDMIAATTWSWEGVAASLDPVAVIDTRPERATPAVARRPPSLQGVLAIGVGTTRVGGWRADAVIAKGPSRRWHGCADGARRTRCAHRTRTHARGNRFAPRRRELLRHHAGGARHRASRRGGAAQHAARAIAAAGCDRAPRVACLTHQLIFGVRPTRAVPVRRQTGCAASTRICA